MARVSLASGAYSAKSVIADAQRCVNLYPEVNPGAPAGMEPSPTTHYLTPGLGVLVSLGSGQVRGLYTASNGQVYAVIREGLYLVSPAWVLTKIGSLTTTTGPVKMKDNSLTMLVVDGTENGLVLTLGVNVVLPITDGTGAWVGSGTVDYIDTFMLFNMPNGGSFYSTLSNSVTFDPLYYGAKSGGNDLLVTLAVIHRELWLFGVDTTEVWQNVGGALFPFAAAPGVFIQHGCAAPFSVATADNSVMWLGRDPQGAAIVFQGQGYKVHRISTHALEVEFQKYALLYDAVAYTYQQGGHVFYVLTFPTADKTWVYDMATQMWHERAWCDGDGELHRHRGNCHTYGYGVNIVGDWENGTLYAMADNFTSDVFSPIVRIRSFPHMMADGKRAVFQAFTADCDTGQMLDPNQNPQISLRWSVDRGKTWGNPVPHSLGKTGQGNIWPTWRRLGIARDMVFELRWDNTCITALNGAFVDSQALAT